MSALEVRDAIEDYDRMWEALKARACATKIR